MRTTENAGILENAERKLNSEDTEPLEDTEGKLERSCIVKK